MHFINKSHCVKYRHNEHCTSVAWGLSRCKYGALRGKLFGSGKVYLYEAVKGPRLGVYKGTVHNVYMKTAVQIRMYIHHLVDGSKGWHMKHIDCLCLSYRELMFAVEFTKNRLLESLLPFLHPALFSYTHIYTLYTNLHTSCCKLFSLERDTFKKNMKRQEWPHFYVHSVCTVSSASVRPQLL